MLFVAFLGLTVVSVPLFRGRLSSLAEVRFRASWALGIALVLQAVFVFHLAGPNLPTLYGVLHVTSYLLAGYFLWTNRKVPGAWLIALGGAMNLLAIVANYGVMPASPEALASAGLIEAPRWFTNSAALPDPNLAFLGDVFAIPRPFPFPNVFSAGDILVALGGAFALHRLCGSRLLPSGSGQLVGLMRFRDFRRLWAAQAISNLGDWTYALAVATSLAGRKGAAHILALLLIAEIAPAAVAGALGGPLIDRLPRKALMIGSDLLRGLAVASLFLDGTPSLSHFYAVAVMLGLLRALFQPSLYASLPNVVPQERLVGANALISVTYHAAVMIGPIIGGLLVALAGPTVAFGVNAASFGVSAAFLAGVRLPRRVHPEAGSTPWRELAEGVRYSLDNRLVRWVLAITGLIMIGASIKAPLEPLFVLRTLGRQPAALGLVGGAWGLGMMLGSIGAPAAANRWPRERLLGISAAVVGLCILAVSRAAALPPILLMWLVAGAANAIGTVSYESLLQERTPDALRGRVMAASEAVLDGTFLVGVSLAGWLGETAGIRGAFVVSGVIFLATGVLSHVLLAPSTKRPEAPDVGEEHPDPALEPLSVGSVSGSHESTSGLFPDSWAASASGPAPAREFDPVSVPDGRVEPPPAPPVPEPVAAPAQAVATAARSEWTAYQLTRPISPPRLPRPLSRPLPRRPALRLGRRSASIAAGVAVLVAGGFVLWLRPWQPEPTGLALALERGNTMVFRIEAWSSWTMEPGYAGRLDSELEGLLTVKPLDYKNGSAKTNATLQAWSLTINGRPVSRPPSPRARIHLSSRGQVLRGAELRLPSPSAPLLLAAAGLSPTLSETLVRPGDSWSGWTHVRLFGGRARVRASGRLLRYEEHGDINAAVVQGTRKIFLKGAPLLGKGKIVVDQTAWIDPETGDVLRSEAVLRVDLRGRALGGRPPIEGTTTLRLLAVS